MPPHRRKLLVAVFSFGMVLCASVSNSAMDALTTRYDRSVFHSLPERWQPWFDPQVSYKNKWKDGDRTRGEAFPLSSTALVPATDAWHFFKWLTVLCLWAAILAPFTLLFHLRWYYWVLIFVAADVFRGLAFEVFYTRLLIK